MYNSQINQTELMFDAPFVSENFRPIHYLGSKLRILDFLGDVIEEVAPSNGGLCDLFSGSGTVSRYFSTKRPVTSVDIQEYSRVLCSALLFPLKEYKNINFIQRCKNSNIYTNLHWALEPLMSYENACINKALSGNINPLCELIEDGSIINFEQTGGEEISKDLLYALKDSLSRLNKKNLINGPDALIVRYFGGLYFSYKQAVNLDVLLENASGLEEEIKDSFLAAIISSASDAVNTIGKQFAQPLQPRKSDGTPKNILTKVQKDRNIDIFLTFEKWLNRYSSLTESTFKHNVYKLDFSDALDLLTSETKVIYADPPYTRDHYSRFYHVLETICLRDNPKLTLTSINGKKKISRGVYREERYQSSFCIRSQAPIAFNILFKKSAFLETPLLLSYSPFAEGGEAHPRLLTINQLTKIAKEYYKNVDLVSAGHFLHSRLNNTDKHLLKSSEGELLLVCTKPY